MPHMYMEEYPRWVPTAVVGLVSALATVSIVGAAEPLAVAPFMAVAVTPWVLELTERPLPRWLFVLVAGLPLLALNVAGEALGILSLGEASGGTPGDYFSRGEYSMLMLVFLVGEVAATSARRELVITIVLALVTVFGRAAAQPDVLAEAAFWIAACLIAFGCGFLMRRQAETLSELRATQSRLIGEAALQERQRIAREVHDIVAHSLTVTMMHLTAARMAVRRDPASAGDALEEAERLGRESLAEIRRTVQLLRGGHERGTDRTLPDATDIDALLEGYRAAGVDVEVSANGELRTLDAATGLTVYRILQEAVANAAKHAPGAPVRIAVDAVPDGIRIEVANPVPAHVTAERPTGGVGLVGMRERVEATGGRVDAGVRGGRWRVVATLPVDEETSRRWCGPRPRR